MKLAVIVARQCEHKIGGNLARLRFTALLKRLQAGSYIAAMSESRITFWPRTIKIRSVMSSVEQIPRWFLCSRLASQLRYGTNEYSPPAQYRHRDMLVKGYINRVEGCLAGNIIARHPSS